MSDRYAPLAPEGSEHKAAGRGRNKAGGGVAQAFAVVMPVPPDAPAPPDTHLKLGRPSSRWLVTDDQGQGLHWIVRFDLPDGQKQVLPLCFCRPANGGEPRWKWAAPPEPRPLVGLSRLAARPRSPVLVVEGEKCADAATMLAPGYVCVTSTGGSNSASKADWTPLRGRDVTIQRDNDKPGLHYQEEVIKGLLAAGVGSIKVVTPPEDAPEGWDIADALREAWTPDRVAQLLTGAVPIAMPGSEPKPEGAVSEPSAKSPRRMRAGDRILALAVAECSLWHWGREGYANFVVDGCTEAAPLNSHEFEDWLSSRSAEELGTVPSVQAIKDVVRVLRFMASRSVRQEPWLRLGFRDGCLYIDLANERREVIEIATRAIVPEGRCWRILRQHDLPFTRSGAMQDLPVPVEDDACSIDELRRFVNVAEEADFVLIVGWLLGALRYNGPYPILVLSGSQGTGKSILTTLLRSLVDPNAAPIRSAPRDDRELFVSAINAHVMAIDNMSSVPVWLSDALCRLATRGGFATRSMYLDKTETVLQACRPIILNGIPALTDRPDLADRAITVHLKVIPESERKTEREMMEDWADARPRILAALCDALAVALRRFPETRLPKAPRQADFATWVTAAEPGLGWEPGTFLRCYTQTQVEMREDAFEGTALAMALDAFARDRRQWTGNATALLAHLNDSVQEATRRHKTWPDGPRRLTNDIRRIAEPLLRPRGVSIRSNRSNGVRTITITFDPTVAPLGQSPSE